MKTKINPNRRVFNPIVRCVSTLFVLLCLLVTFQVKAQIYARAEHVNMVRTLNTVPPNYSDVWQGDVYIRFYSDHDCVTPTTLPANATVKFREENFSSIYGYSTNYFTSQSSSTAVPEIYVGYYLLSDLHNIDGGTNTVGETHAFYVDVDPTDTYDNSPGSYFEQIYTL